MIFLSQIIGTDVIDSKQDLLGEVRDILVSTKEKQYPLVEGIVIKDENGKQFFIDYDDIETFGNEEMTLRRKNCAKSFSPSSKDILLHRDILDKQIFDIDSIRVVRVNDLQLAKVKDNFRLVAIDVGSRPIIRRLGVSFLLGRFFKSELIDWHSIDFVEEGIGGIKLKTPYEKLMTLHPADIANLIEDLSLEEGSHVIEAIDSDTAADVLAEVEPHYKDILLERLDSKNLSEVVKNMPSDEAADVIQDLSHHKKKRVLKHLDTATASQLRNLVTYKEDHAGSLMNSDFIAVDIKSTVAKAIDTIRTESDNHPSVYHIFIKDKDNHLKGIVSMRTLLLADPKESIADILSEVVATVSPETDYEEIAELMTKYNLLSLVVVDEENTIQGIVTFDDIMRILVPNA